MASRDHHTSSVLNKPRTITRADVVVVGGGIMGCTTALHLATSGMRVTLVERGALCAAASGVNAGTLSIQIKRAALVPYAMRGWELWKSSAQRLGADTGFHVRGGLTLAFTEGEADLLKERMEGRRQAGAPIEFVSSAGARAIDPGVTDRIVLASYCALDAYANASVTGFAHRIALRRAAVDVREHVAVTEIAADGVHYVVRTASGGTLVAPRIVLAAGAWLGRAAAMLGVNLPVHARVNQVSVTERRAPLVRVIVGHAMGLLTLKQSQNGTVLIGGGWQGIGDADTGRTRVDTANLVGNLRLACYAVPGLEQTRLLRTWHGFEAHVPDLMPLAGRLPNHTDAYVLGCVRGGWTIGPYIGQLLADQILGRVPEMPLFPLDRFGAAATGPAAD